ncbi:MAG: FUSC family protein [Burkholderiales bacterium]
MNPLQRFRVDDMRGVHYAVSVFVATTLLWILVKEYGDSNPIWAISSMVATSDPQMRQALSTFSGRILNTLLGCAVGLLFVWLGHTEWQLPFAMAATVILSAYFVRIPTMWRQAPITAAIVIAAGLQQHQKLTAMEHGAQRVGEVLFGCIVGIAVAWALSKIWPLREPAGPRASDQEGARRGGA